MSKKSVEQEHSGTAIGAALIRAVANKEFNNKILGSDYLAEYFLPFFFKIVIRTKRF